jgi:hypothetical protein
MASQVPEALIAQLAAETGLSTDEVRRVAERAAHFVDALKATGVVREEGLIGKMACIKCLLSWILGGIVFGGPIRKIFWCVVCALLWRA